MIHEFDYKPNYGIPDEGARNFGVELELVCKKIQQEIEKSNNFSEKFQEEIDELAEETYPAFSSDCIFKKDGSLDAASWEIVTKPLSLSGQKEFWTPQIFKYLISKGLISYNTKCCGMHVHVSRKSLSLLQIAKLVKFIYNKENYKFIKKIAQREEKGYAEFSSNKSFSYVKDKNASKYSAINLCNENTIEFRLFKGTLNHNAFHKNLEFCDALIDFCAPSVSGVKESKEWWSFTEYLSINRKRYTFLWDFCKFHRIDDVNSWSDYLEERKFNKLKVDKIGESFPVVNLGTI